MAREEKLTRNKVPSKKPPRLGSQESVKRGPLILLPLAERWYMLDPRLIGKVKSRGKLCLCSIHVG